MRAFLICMIVVLGCRERTLTVIDEQRRAPPAAAPRRVALRPPSNARELAQGVYATQLRAANADGAAIETMGEIVLIETMYDPSGRELATSVPSMTWSDLTPDARVGLAGMRAGERRRIWRCKDGEAAPCAVEDVQVLQREDEVVRRP